MTSTGRPAGSDSMAKRISIQRATPEHAESMAAFFRLTWDSDATAESVIAGRNADSLTNPALRGEDTPTYLFLEGDRTTGYVSTIPVRLWDNGAECTAFWVKGLMVLPELRNGPIGVLLAKELVRNHGPLLAMTVQLPARRVFEALGFRAVGTLRSDVRILAPSEVLRRLDLAALGVAGVPSLVSFALKLLRRTCLTGLAGWCTELASKIWTRVQLPAIRDLRVIIDEPAEDSELDGLWARVRQEIGLGVVRDAAFLNYRYAGREASNYCPVLVRDHAGLLEAIGYVKRPSASDDPRLSGLRVATLSELVCSPRNTRAMSALIGGIERASKMLGGHAVMSSSSVPAIARVLRTRAWLPAPATFHFFAKGGSTLQTAGLDAWWLTRGDGGSDGGL